MKLEDVFFGILKEVFDAQLLGYTRLGGGVAGGIIYKLELDKSPFAAIIKTAENKTLLKKECEYIRKIQQYADIKLPKIYSDFTVDDKYYILMEYFDGVNCLSDFVLNASKENRARLADEIAENLIKLQTVKGEKYGDLLFPSYDSWNDYYKSFAESVVNEAEGLYRDGYITKDIFDFLHKAFDLYDVIFDEPVSKPTIIHGDYWAANLIVNKDLELIGVLDPFNCMWGDSEYELFALNAVHNGKIPVLEAFLAKQTVSRKFMLKNYFYFLFSEVYWVAKLHHDNIDYLNEIISNLDAEMKRFNIN